jgi:fibronectin-binding autotransporter adhesin
MNTRKLFTFGFLIVLLLMAFTAITMAQKTYYLNVTDGDDSYTGANQTNSPPGSGPKRTINGVVLDAASQTAGTTITVNIAAGTYNVDQSGIGGGNDGAGVAITGNYNYVFVVSLFNANTTVTIPAGLTVNVSTGRSVTWQAAGGTEKLTVSAALNLTKGTFDVSGLSAFNTSSSTVVSRDAGTITGTVTHGSNVSVVYTGSGNKTAGNEVPANIGTGSINVIQTSGTVTFGAAVTASTGGIVLTSGSATFTNAITLTPSTGTSLALINNSASGTLTFNGAVTVNGRAAQGNFVNNASSGSIVFNGGLAFVNNSSASGSWAAASATLLNAAGGTLTLSGGISETISTDPSGPTDYDFTVALTNGAAGTVNVGGGGATTINDNITNDNNGKINLNGSVTFSGAALSNNSGSSTFALGGYTLTVSSAATVTNAGAFTSSGVGTGFVTFTKSSGTANWNGVGSTANIERDGKVALVFDASARTISGNLVNNNSTGGITIGGAAHSITGAIVNTAGTLAINGATAVTGGVSLNGGSIVLGANLTVSGDFNTNGGAFDYGASTLELKGNFNRISGTVTPNAGTLLFDAGGAQTFAGGANYAVNTFSTSGIGTAVTFQSSVIINGNASIGANTSVALGTFNLRMAGDGATFSLAGGYTSSAGGGIIFEAPTADQTITGTNIYSNIEIRLGDVSKHVIVPNGQTVTWSGILTFSRGGIAVGTSDGGAAVLNPSNVLVVPSIYVNLGGAPDGKGITTDVDANATANGSFNGAGVSYNLGYFGTLTADRTVGAEFVSGTPGKVIDLSVTAAGGGFKVALGDALYEFTGNLTVGAGTVLSIPGTAAGRDLVAKGSNTTLTVTGSIVTPATGVFKVSGSAVTVTGSAATTASNTSSIGNAEMASSGLVTVSNLKEFTGNLNLSAGELHLGLVAVTGFATSGQITGTYTQASGTTLVLTADLVTAGVSNVDGTIDLGAYNWLLMNNITAAGTTTFANAPTAADNGFLQFGSTLTADLGDVGVPRLELAATATGQTVTFAGGVEVTDVFMQSRGNLDLATFNLVISGGTWTSALDDADDGTYDATTIAGTTGSVVIGGNTTLTMYEALTVPNLELNTNGTFTLATDDMDTPTFRTLYVAGTGVFTMTTGTLALGNEDLEVDGGAGAFVYAAGTITAATSTDPTDSDIGELIFNNGALSTTPASGLVVPNLTVNANATISIGSTTDFTVSNRLTIGATTGLTTPADSRLKIADGCWIVSAGDGATGGGDRLSKLPNFLGKVNLAYLTVTQSTGKEMPTTATTLKDLYVDVGDGAGPVYNTLTLTTASSTKPVVVNGTLTLASGTLTYDSTRPLQLVDGGAVTVMNHTGNAAGRIDPASSVAALAPAGAYTLTYTGTGAGGIKTTTKEWPSTANITELVVKIGKGGSAPANRFVYLHSGRTVGMFTLNAATSASGIYLSPDATPTAVTNLTVTGLITVTKGTIYAPVLPATGASGQLIAQGDVNMSGGSFDPNSAPQLVFSGSADQAFTLSGNQSVFNLTLNQSGTAPVHKVTLSGGNLTVTGTMTFNNGLFYTGDDILILTNPVGVSGQGFVRSLVAGGKSHVVGSVRQVLKSGSLIAFGRNEFPVGDADYYRPAALTFVNPAAGNIYLGIATTIKYDPTAPTGTFGLPIADGVSTGVDIARFAPFYWAISTSGSLGQTQFNLELTAEGYSDFDDVANVRIIRRSGTLTDVGNTWSLQGAQYDNFVINGIPTVVNVNSTGGLIPGGAIYTYGLKSNMVVANAINPISLSDASKTFTRDLTNPALFTGAKGTITYSVTVDNPAVASVSITGNVLTVTQKVSGTTFITVIGTDIDGSRISYKVNVTCVSDVAIANDQIPTEFALMQNYPNPFNPSTTIRFGLPKEAPVTLEIYNLLGMRVRTLMSGQKMSAAFYNITWNGRDDAGYTVPSGIYIYRIVADQFVMSKKMTLIK